MPLNTFIEISKSYMAKPSKDFIEYRDGKAKEWSPRRADAEYPEYHQQQIDPKQTKYTQNTYAADTIWEGHGVCDYKQFAKAGFKISDNTQKSILNGTTQKIVVWRWSNGNRWDPLQEGKSVGYDIMGIVDAQEALDNSYIDEKGDRRCKLF